MLTRASVEDAIIDLSDRLDDLTHTYAEACDEAADAEIEWRIAADIIITRMRSATKGAPSERDRERYARRAHEAEWRRHMLAKAQIDSLRNAIAVHRTRLDALRTLSASVREQT